MEVLLKLYASLHSGTSCNPYYFPPAPLIQVHLSYHPSTPDYTSESVIFAIQLGGKCHVREILPYLFHRVIPALPVSLYAYRPSLLCVSAFFFAVERLMRVVEVKKKPSPL
ncbi:hypothetical protein BDQ17DRAFT_1431878 [Cyathus striatus]|nr:hypothetical protein BDQ17DRAFT_1431878 [Cyathus striatus]